MKGTGAVLGRGRDNHLLVVFCRVKLAVDLENRRTNPTFRSLSTPASLWTVGDFGLCDISTPPTLTLPALIPAETSRLETRSLARLWSCSSISSVWKTTSAVKRAKSPCTFTAVWLQVIFVEAGGWVEGADWSALWNGFKGVSSQQATRASSSDFTLFC